MLYFACLALALSFPICIAAFGGAFGQGKATAAAMEAMARQPEAAGQIQTGMIIGLAFIESLTIYALVAFFLLVGKLPETAEIVSKLGS